MGKGKTFFTKNNPRYVGEVVSDTPKADAKNTLSVNADGYAKEVEVNCTSFNLANTLFVKVKKVSAIYNC